MSRTARPAVAASARHLQLVPSHAVPAVVGDAAPQPAAAQHEGLSACACGHVRTAHLHYRPGSDCSSCGCRQFRRRGLWSRARPA